MSWLKGIVFIVFSAMLWGAIDL